MGKHKFKGRGKGGAAAAAKIAASNSSSGGIDKQELAREGIKTGNTVLKYLFIICLVCCVLPGLYKTLTSGVKNKDELIACKFGKKQAMTPEAINKKLMSDISNIMKSHTDISKTESKSAQSITIKSKGEFNRYDTRGMLMKECPGGGLLGLLGITTLKTQAYGCSYDIDQTSTVKLSEIKKEIVNESTKINQNIINKLKIQVKGSKGDSGPENKKKMKFIDDMKDITEKTVKSYLNKLSEKSISNKQSLVVEMPSYGAACGCTDETKNPKITQDFQFQVYSNELVDKVKNVIRSKAIESDIDLDLEGVSETGKQVVCIFQILASLASVVLIIYLIINVLGSKKDKQV